MEALLKNLEAADSDLIIFSDAARTPDKEGAVRRVREYVAGIEGFRSLTVHHRPQNFGLAKSIIEGVTEVLTDREQVIVLEDDLETSPHFLRYMNEALSRYADDDRVISVHGWVYPTDRALPEAFFLRGADCWGWATWRRGWTHFNPDGQLLLDELKRKKLVKAFDFNGAYSYSGMLQGQVDGSNDSWAVRWHASAFLANKLTLYPGRSLVHNIGNDSSGEHCSTSSALDVELSDTPICLDNTVVEESAAAKTAIEHFLARPPLLQRLYTRLMPKNIRHRLIIVAKDWLPPALVRQLRRLSWLGEGISFEGPFASWEDAQQRSSGYDAETILEKVLSATLKVKSGEAAYERDSILFDEIQYAWPVTAGLMWAAARNDGRLSVLDFGGSLGSSYFQNRKFLEGLDRVRWSVVEQAHFVEAGRLHIQEHELAFYTTIAECVAVERPNVVLLSSVLQYLPDPYVVLDELIGSAPDVVVIDLTIVNSEARDRIFVQNVPKTIYQASYPVYALSEDRWVKTMNMAGYALIEKFPSISFPALAYIGSHFKGYIFMRKSR